VPPTLEPTRTKLSEKGRIVIPQPFRQALGLQAGDTLILEIIDGDLRISSFESRLKRTQELLQKYAVPGESWADQLSAERREEAQREEDEAQQWMEKKLRHG
jgi:AbrB family looped-hinge helix DNA binding protein